MSIHCDYGEGIAGRCKLRTDNIGGNVVFAASLSMSQRRAYSTCSYAGETNNKPII